MGTTPIPSVIETRTSMVMKLQTKIHTGTQKLMVTRFAVAYFKERENIYFNVDEKDCLKDHIHFIQCVYCSGFYDNITILWSGFKEH